MDKRSFETAYLSEDLSDRVLLLHVTDSEAGAEHKAKIPKHGSECKSSAKVIRIPVSAAILASCSTFFLEMFSGGTMEANNRDRTPDIYLSSEDLPRFEDVIEFMYKGEVPERAREAKNLIFGLLKVADQFETPSCVQSCFKLLESAEVSLSFVLKCLSLPASVKKAPEARCLLERASSFLGWKSNDFLSIDSAADLRFEAFKQLLGADWGPDCEALLFSCLLEWARKNPEPRAAVELLTLLALIKFPFMDRSFLDSEVAAAPEIKSNLGQLAIQKARTFQDVTDAERSAMRGSTDPQFVPRASKSLDTKPPPSDLVPTEYVVDIELPVKDYADLRLQPDEYYIHKKYKAFNVGPEAKGTFDLRREPHNTGDEVQTGGGDWGGNLGVYFRLFRPGGGGKYIVASSCIIVFPGAKAVGRDSAGMITSTSLLHHIFQNGQTEEESWCGVSNIGLTWSRFLFCDSPALKDGSLKVRLIFKNLRVY